jgi:hypothetical protein
LKARVLSPWIIFKGKVQQTKWTTKLRALRSEHEFPGYICVFENGWTDNELGIEWLKECFELGTADGQKGNGDSFYKTATPYISVLRPSNIAWKRRSYLCVFHRIQPIFSNLVTLVSLALKQRSTKTRSHDVVALELTIRLTKRCFLRSIVKYGPKLCVNAISNMLGEILVFYRSILKSCFRS